MKKCKLCYDDTWNISDSICLQCKHSIYVYLHSVHRGKIIEKSDIVYNSLNYIIAEFGRYNDTE